MNLLLVLLTLPLVLAFKFNPMSQSIELAEGQKAAQFLIENDTQEAMAIELSVKERIMDEAGKETLPATSEFSIFPPQMIIPPKEKRTIRVNWKGPIRLEHERSFRVIAEQLPLKVDPKTKKQTGIQMLMRYMAALYVTPKDAEPALSISGIKSEAGKLELVVENTGSKHQMLTNPVLTLTHKASKWKLLEKDLEGLAGENILARSKRTFVLKSDLNLPADALGSIKVND